MNTRLKGTASRYFSEIEYFHASKVCRTTALPFRWNLLRVSFSTCDPVSPGPNYSLHLGDTFSRILQSDQRTGLPLRLPATMRGNFTEFLTAGWVSVAAGRSFDCDVNPRASDNNNTSVQRYHAWDSLESPNWQTMKHLLHSSHSTI